MDPSRNRFDVLRDLEDPDENSGDQPNSKPDSEPDFAHPFFKNVRFNWATHSSGCINLVRNQKRAMACYAFPAVDCVYAEYRLRNEEWMNTVKRYLSPLSPQELIDCIHEVYPLTEEKKAKWDKVIDPAFGYPSTVKKAFKYIQNEGVAVEKQYPFTERKGPCVKPLDVTHKVFIRGYKKIQEGDNVIECLCKQPLAGSITFVCSLMNYDGNGVYMGPTAKERLKLEAEIEKGNPIPQHALQIVGFGIEDDGTEFYLCKNSWGTRWGHKGYFKISRLVVERISYPFEAYIKKARRV